MRFCDEQRLLVRGCIPAGVKLSDEQFDVFVAALEGSVTIFEQLRERECFREAHDALRNLWLLCTALDPQPPLIRKVLRELPRVAVEHMERRFRKLQPEIAAEVEFQKWAADLPRLDLPKISFVVAEGGKNVEGRSRGSGKKSERHFEPVIMGVARGANDNDYTGGRPNTDLLLQMIGFLAVDWLKATGSMPAKSRQGQFGFSGLVHDLFHWLRINETAENTLRRYWQETTKERNIPDT